MSEMLWKLLMMCFDGISTPRVRYRNDVRELIFYKVDDGKFQN